MKGSVAVTGLGIVAANGVGVEEYWKATLAGASGVGRITRFDSSGYPSQLAGEVREVDFTAHLTPALLAQTDTITRLALVAADLAFEDAGFQPGQLPDWQTGAVTASTCGGFEFGQRELSNLWSKGPQYVSAYQSFAWFYAVNSGQLSIRHALKGPSSVVVSDQAGGLDAVAIGARQMAKGARLVIAGGIDSRLCPWSWVAEMAGGRMSTCNDITLAYRPFEADACGGVPGEGGALLVLEEADSARQRPAAHVYGLITGHASTFDARPGTPGGPGLERAVRLALERAGCTAGDIDVVFADAAGLPALDQVEADTLASVFGPRGVPVTAPKTMTGRVGAGAGPLDVATALLSLREQVIPPTIHTVGTPALDLVRCTPRPALLSRALILARGYPGFNSALVVTAPSVN
ncbi:ketosynthase chain-length factor [Streptomyces sp. NPDC056480]|uniref:ketosynthase chain-length factor n=1 Tax=Streptomyces sp. NPDC056480 TaxID=3345833 RepID=UPI0036C20BEC